MTPKTRNTDRPAWMGKPLLDAEDRDAAAAANAPTSQDYRRRCIADGLARYVRRFERTGQKNAAKKLAALHQQLVDLLAERDGIEKKLSGKRADPLAAAQKAAAAQLLEVLPNCFADEAEARLFAAKLPLTSAVRAANAEIARLRQLWREQKGIDQKFWAAAIEAGRLATGKALADDENLKALANAGL
jgi:hypothetical protein